MGCLPGFTHSEYSLSDLDGNHRRRPNIPSSPSHRQGRVHARHEGQLDHLAVGLGVCPEIPPRAYMGSFLQHRGLCDWDVHQCTYQEEEVGCIEEEGKRQSQTWVESL